MSGADTGPAPPGDPHEIDVLEAIDAFFQAPAPGVPANADVVLAVVRDYRDVSPSDVADIDRRLLASRGALYGTLGAFVFEPALPAPLVEAVALEFGAPDAPRPRGVSLGAHRRAERARAAEAVAALGEGDRLILALALVYRRFLRYQLELASEAVRRLSARLDPYLSLVHPRRLADPSLHGARSAFRIAADLEAATADIAAKLGRADTLHGRLRADLPAFIAMLRGPERLDLVEALVDEPWAHRFEGVAADVAVLNDHLRHASEMIETVRAARRDRWRLQAAVGSVAVAVVAAALNSVLRDPEGLMRLVRGVGALLPW